MNYYNPYSYFQTPQYNTQMTPQAMPQNAPQAPVMNDNPMVWVQGEAGAKAYPVAPNATVVLWDSERPTIYIKKAEPSGMPSMRCYDYTERTAAPSVPTTEYVSRKEFEELKDKITKLTEKENSNESAV